MFTKSTVIIGIILTIISGIGSWLKPDSTLIIIAIAGLIIALIVITDRFNQIDENHREIEELKYVGALTVGRVLSQSHQF